MNTLKHFIVGALAVAAPALAAILATPTVQHFVAAHPILSAYLPILSGVIVAAYHRWATRNATAATQAAPTATPPATK